MLVVAAVMWALWLELGDGRHVAAVVVAAVAAAPPLPTAVPAPRHPGEHR